MYYKMLGKKIILLEKKMVGIYPAQIPNMSRNNINDIKPKCLQTFMEPLQNNRKRKLN